MGKGLLSLITRSAKGIIGSIWTPPSGTATINGDLDVTGSINGPAFSNDVGASGSVSVIENVENATLKNQLFGSPFVNDILVGGATYISVSGDVFLYRINTAGVITWEVYTSATDGALAPTANTESVFSMTELGVWNAPQVLAMASLGVTVTISDRIDALSQANANTVMPTLQPDYVYGYDPSKVIKVVNRGNNLALLDNLIDGGYNSSGAGITGPTTLEQQETGFQAIFDASAIALSLPIDFQVGEELSLGYTVSDLAGTVRTYFIELDKDGSFIQSTAIQVTTTNGARTASITPSANTKTLLFNMYSAAVNSAVTVTLFQANQGSTALPYKAPKNSPFLCGSLSENLSRDTDYDGTDEVEFTAPRDGTYFLAYDTTGTWATGAVITATVELSKGKVKTWTGLGASVVEHMVLAGDYTESEIRALGHVPYAPFILHNVGDGSDNTPDRLYQVGSQVMWEKNNEVVDGYELGDDVIDSTALTSGTLTVGRQYTIKDFIAGDDFTNVGGTNVDGNVFIATGTTPTTWTNSSELNAHNVWQSSSPETVDITDLGLALTSLNQVADEGPNHMLMDGNMIATVTYETGFQAVANDVRINKQEINALQQDNNPIYTIALTTPAAGLAAGSSHYEPFSEITNCPDYMGDIVMVQYSNDTNCAFEIFDNGVLITATTGGLASGDTFYISVASGKPVIVREWSV